MAHLTRDEILARKTGKGIATFPDGSTVGIRGLTRDEVLSSNDKTSLTDRDNFIVATGMTAPKMTEEEVAAWGASGDAGDLVAVSEQIAKLSGLLSGANKEAMRTFRDRPGD
ncbi:hypothetical protein [Salinispora arenicola]|uniref:hypothetical protein n=1 Tax=Salinispora arenicola TaxID=168697 RepID=UPI00035F11F3|nr:hypothetical protein [Salinispora arenicola]